MGNHIVMKIEEKGGGSIEVRGQVSPAFFETCISVLENAKCDVEEGAGNILNFPTDFDKEA